MAIRIKSTIWNKHFKTAKTYYKQNNHLLPQGLSPFVSWISINRKYKYKGILSLDKIKMLNSIGMVWDLAESKWNENFLTAEIFFKKNGHLNQRHGSKLGNWLLTNRSLNTNNNLSLDRITKLESIGMVWLYSQDNWNKQFDVAKIFFTNNGHLNMAKTSPLNLWLSRNRTYRKQNILALDRIEKLETIGMIWDCYDDSWNKLFFEAKEFFEVNGHIKTKLSIQLNNFLNLNRQHYFENKMTIEKIRLLEDIGMVWKPLESNWNKIFEEAQLYYKTNGNLKFESRSFMMNWLVNCKQFKRLNKMPEERIKKLESIGVVWLKPKLIK